MAGRNAELDFFSILGMTMDAPKEPKDAERETQDGGVRLLGLGNPKSIIIADAEGWLALAMRLRPAGGVGGASLVTRCGDGAVWQRSRLSMLKNSAPPSAS